MKKVMTTILELEVNPQQEKLLKEMLIAMNITFRNQLVDESYSEKEIGEAVKKCFGIWKDREDFSDFIENKLGEGVVYDSL
jgi:hypothetical protein